MTHCRACGCKLESGDICRRCEYEQSWLSTPEYFCTSKECGRFLPGATEPGLCDACKKLAQIPYRPLKKPIKIEIKVTKTETKPEPEAKSDPKLKPQEKYHMEKTEKCNDCNAPITARRKRQSGLCERCFGRHWARKKAQKTQTGTKTTLGAPVKNHPAQPAPKTGAGFQKMSGVGECCPEPAANTIHASKPPKPEPIKIDEIDVCRQVINKHGISRQLAKAAEEFSEAAAAISRFLAGEGEYTEIIGEVADVEVMCVQMRLIYGTDSIDQARAEKVARLHGRLKL